MAADGSGDPQRLAEDIARRVRPRETSSDLLGIEIVSVGPGRCTTRMRVRDDMLNGHGLCHGGIIFTLADTAFAWACNSRNVKTLAQSATIAFLAPAPVFLAFLLVWGVTVVGDSPQFSALNAANAPRAFVGSALTLANCIGFAITIPAIELLNAAAGALSVQYLFLLLAPGPVFGLLAMRPLLRTG